MATIIDLYLAMKNDSGLQKNWEKNQPRIDRAFESPLIARTPREVATAALLVIKLKYEPAAADFTQVTPDDNLISFAKTQGMGGKRLANVIEGKTRGDDIAKVAAIHSLRFYQDRSTASHLIRMPWSREALEAIACTKPEELINPALKPTWALRKATSVSQLASFLTTNSEKMPDNLLRSKLRSIPGLGPERADAVGVFAFYKPWPIVDQYLWSLLFSHGLIKVEQEKLKGYDQRREAFEPYWKELITAEIDEPNEIAATLYLWADEAARFGYHYSF